MSPLDSEMHSILLRFEMVSHGSTQAWNASGGHSGEPDDKMVATVMRAEVPPHVMWRVRYEMSSEEGKPAIVKAAAEELEAWTKRTAPMVGTTKTVVDFIIEDGVGWEPEVVARRFNVLPAFVRKHRARRNLGTEDGRPVGDDPVDRPSTARLLRARGLSTRQIAVTLDTSQSQVMRWIRDAA